MFNNEAGRHAINAEIARLGELSLTFAVIHAHIQNGTLDTMLIPRHAFQSNLGIFNLEIAVNMFLNL